MNEKIRSGEKLNITNIIREEKGCKSVKVRLLF